jgi:hypothetical protein
MIAGVWQDGRVSILEHPRFNVLPGTAIGET